MLNSIPVGELQFPIIAIGSTYYGGAIENIIPKDHEFNRRDSVRNTYIGSVLSHPDVDTFVIGRSYIDQKDNGEFDEDYLVYRVSLRTVVKFYGTSFEKKFRQYAGSHHGDKSYLMQQD